MAKNNLIHFIGIGGIGMSALARYFLSEGYKVSGSDLTRSPITDALKKEGAVIYIGKHSANNLRPDVSTVIYNQAIPNNNPELKKARQLASEHSRRATIKIQSYPEAIGELTRKYQTIAIAGAHGKTTTTAMTTLVLIEAGLDPTVIVGSLLKEFSPHVIARIRQLAETWQSYTNIRSPRSARDDSYGVNFRKGQSPWLILEADEWKASFLHYAPEITVITNIDKEHLDFYKNFANVKKAFEKFRNQCGIVLERPKNPAIAKKIKAVLKIPGEHNIQNALLAYAIGQYLKIPEKIILRALGKYTGAWRRMEYRGKLNVSEKFKVQSSKFKVLVYDDYAHHPTEIKATLAGFREKYPKNALICVFQPHQMERLKLLFNDFKTAFKDADQLILIPTYEVAGRENSKAVAENRRLIEKLAQATNATYIIKPEKDLKKSIENIIKSLPPKPYPLNPIIVMMGAGDIINYTQLLLK